MERADMFPLLDLCVSSLRRDHADLLCIVPMFTHDPQRESGDNKHVLMPEDGEAKGQRRRWRAAPGESLRDKCVYLLLIQLRAPTRCTRARRAPCPPTPPA